MTPEKYTEIPPVSLQVLWYPRGVKNAGTIPRIGFIAAGHPKGIADIIILPTQDGACDYKDHVFHISDGRLYDSYGKFTRGAEERGCWEFSPMSVAYLESMSKKKKA